MRASLIAMLGVVVGCRAGENAVGRDPDLDSVPPITTVLTLEHTKADGDGQTGTVRALLPQPLKVRVMNGSVPISGVFVAWGTEQPDAEFQPELSKSDEFGYARTSFRPGSRAGLVVVTAAIPGVSAYFYASVDASAAFSMEYVSGSGVTLSDFPHLIVMVNDQYGNPVKNHPVSWTVTDGNFGVSANTSYTSSTGQSWVQVLFGDSAGSATVEADITGLTPVVFTLTRN